MRWGVFALLYLALGHLAILGGVAAEIGPIAEAERAYAAAPSCGCSGELEEWCPAETMGTANCRSAVRVRVVATPVTGGQKGNYTHWIILEIYRGMRDGAESRAELARINVIVREEIREAVQRGTEIHAELWRDRITKLRVDGVVFETSASATSNEQLALGAYALVVVLGIGAWLVFLLRRSRSPKRPPA